MKILLAAQVPELFLPLYSRKCARAPRIVSEEEALKLNKNNFQTIRFPIHLEGNLEPKMYACDHHKEHPYPGLKPNDLANKDTLNIYHVVIKLILNISEGLLMEITIKEKL